MPRLGFLTDFACLGQFFNVLVEISPEYGCVPSIWSSQYHGDWHEVLIKFLPGLSSASLPGRFSRAEPTEEVPLLTTGGTDLSL